MTESSSRHLAGGDGPRADARRVRHPAISTPGAPGRPRAVITGVAIASVVPTLTGRSGSCNDYLKQEPLVVDAGVKTGVRIRYENPARSAPTGSWMRGGADQVWRPGVRRGFRHRDHL